MRKKYTSKEKDDTVELFVKNNYNAHETSKQSGVSHLTIKRWYNDLDGEARKAILVKQERLRQIEKKIDEGENGERSIPDIYLSITRIGLERLETLIQNEDSGRNVAYILKVVDEITKGSKSNNPTAVIQNNFFATVEDKIKSLKINPFE